MSQFGMAADNSSCPGVQPADQLQCNVMPCDFCSLTNCAGQVAPASEVVVHPCTPLPANSGVPRTCSPGHVQCS